MKDITLIIPAKNESENIGFVIDQIEKLSLDYFVVLDKKDNQTSDAVKNKDKIIFQDSHGFGNAILSGVKNLKTKYFCILFSDGSTNPDEIPQLYNYLQKTNSDFVFGSRYLKNASSDDDTIITFLGNQIFTFLGKILFNLKISDILYTFVIGKTDCIKKLNLNSQDFSFCVELPILANKNNFLITDYPCHERSRMSGKKNVNELIDGLKILFKMIKLYVS